MASTYENHVNKFKTLDADGEEITVGIKADVDMKGRSISDELDEIDGAYELVGDDTYTKVTNDDTTNKTKIELTDDVKESLDEISERYTLKAGTNVTIDEDSTEYTLTISSEAGMASVETDETLKGDGSTANPLGINASQLQLTGTDNEISITEDIANNKLQISLDKTGMDADAQYAMTTEGWQPVETGMSTVYTDNDSITGDGSLEDKIRLTNTIRNNLAEALGKAQAAMNALQSLGSAITLKGSLPTEEDLPSDANPGDAYLVTGITGTPMFVWDGDDWIELGTMPDLSDYAKKEVLPAVVGDATVIVTEEVDVHGKITYKVHANGGGEGGGVLYTVTSSDQDRIKINSTVDEDGNVTFEIQPQAQYMPYMEATKTVPTTGVNGGFYFVYED